MFDLPISVSIVLFSAIIVRVAFVLRAVQDLQKAYCTEREEKPHV